MSRPDLNLLVTLDVLLAEGSVARAAANAASTASCDPRPERGREPAPSATPTMNASGVTGR